MALPKTLVYNDLTGDEVKHILVSRFQDLLRDIPYLQRHITLPRVRMSLSVTLDCWADQSNPETREISDQLDIQTQREVPGSATEHLKTTKTAVVDASAKGQPPDKVREDHALPVPAPARSKEGWRNLAVSDQLPEVPELSESPMPPQPVEGRKIVMPNGAIVDRTGRSEDTRSSATVVRQDFGPGRERINRDTSPKLRNQHGGGDVLPPNWNNKE